MFKIGDRVKILAESSYDDWTKEFIGNTATVVGFEGMMGDIVVVDIDGDGDFKKGVWYATDKYFLPEKELELLKE